MKFLVVIVSLIATLIAGQAVMQRERNQVTIYVGDPQGALDGTSDCVPCNKICQDLKRYKTDEGRYIVGKENMAFFRLVKARPGMRTPTIVYPGKRPIVGYRGEHETLVARHPLAARIKRR